MAIAFELALNASRPMVTLRLGELGVAPRTIGVVLAVAGFMPFVLGMPAGGLTDRLGPRSVLVQGSLMSAAGFVGVAFSVNGWSTAIWQGMALTGLTACAIASQTIVSHISSPADREQNFGWFTTAVGIGQFFGPGLGGFVADRVGLQSVFVGCAVAGLVPLVMSFLFKSGRSSPGHISGSSLSLKAGARLLQISQLRAVLVVSFLIFVAFDVRSSFLPLYLESINFTKTEIGMMFTAQAVAGLGVRPLMGPLTRWFGPWGLLAAGLAFSIPSFMLLQFTTSMSGVMLVSLGMGLAFGLSQPITLALTAGVAAEQDRGLALGMRITTQRLGSVVSPVILGAIATALTVPAALSGAGLFSFMAMVVCYRSWRLWGKRRSADGEVRDETG